MKSEIEEFKRLAQKMREHHPAINQAALGVPLPKKRARPKPEKQKKRP